MSDCLSGMPSARLPNCLSSWKVYRQKGVSHSDGTVHYRIFVYTGIWDQNKKVQYFLIQKESTARKLSILGTTFLYSDDDMLFFGLETCQD